MGQAGWIDSANRYRPGTSALHSIFAARGNGGLTGKESTLMETEMFDLKALTTLMNALRRFNQFDPKMQVLNNPGPAEVAAAKRGMRTSLSRTLRGTSASSPAPPPATSITG